MQTQVCQLCGRKFMTNYPQGVCTRCQTDGRDDEADTVTIKIFDNDDNDDE